RPSPSRSARSPQCPTRFDCSCPAGSSDRMVRRRELLAYLIGAGVAGTVLVGPYALRMSVASVVPGLPLQQVPFFLLPILWGLWNLLLACRPARLGFRGAGALLGFLVGPFVNLLLLRGVR